MNNNWNQSGSRFDVSDAVSIKPKLDVAIYSLDKDGYGILHLNKLYDKFEFGYKMYGLSSDFVERTKRTWNYTKGNLGILLNGVKGTGKSVTAKQICNSMELPVILINKGFVGIPDFINNIQQDVIILCDEYEKVFSEQDGSILTIMDGVLDNGFRKMFLLTTNQLKVNENLIQRPSRIRYLKTFSDLDKNAIEEIVDDILVHKELRKQVIDFVSKLEIITIDIVKAVVTEVNIHKQDPLEFKDVFNVKTKQIKVYSYLIEGEKETLLGNKGGHLWESIFNAEEPYFNEYIKSKNRYYVFDSIINEEEGLFKIKPEYDDDEDENFDKNDPKHALVIKYERYTPYHGSFAF